MILRSVSTRNFRNLEDAVHEFHPRANVLLGENGQGKTNVLEAIYFLATTKSFRTPRTSNVIRLGAQSVFAEGNCEQDQIARHLSVGILGGDERKRQLRINAQKTPLGEYLHALPVFAYSSSRLEIVRGGPDERRRFLDRGMAGLRVGYLRELARYARVLKQRNALLQRVAEGVEKKSSLDAWDEELLTSAQPIVSARSEYTDALARTVAVLMQTYAFTIGDFRMSYRPAGIDSDAETSLIRIRQMRQRELAAGFTLAGPHRDALDFEVRGVPAADILSSGEIKAATLLLKLAKIIVYKEQMRRSPIFLLDDIDAELDLGVIQRLLGSLLESGQFFTTSAKETVFRLLEMGSHRRFVVRDGTVRRVENDDS